MPILVANFEDLTVAITLADVLAGDADPVPRPSLVLARTSMRRGFTATVVRKAIGA